MNGTYSLQRDASRLYLNFLQALLLLSMEYLLQFVAFCRAGVSFASRDVVVSPTALAIPTALSYSMSVRFRLSPYAFSRRAFGYPGKRYDRCRLFRSVLVKVEECKIASARNVTDAPALAAARTN